MDTTLVDFNERTWERGDISFIYNPAAETVNQHLVVLDNKAKVGALLTISYMPLGFSTDSEPGNRHGVGRRSRCPYVVRYRIRIHVYEADNLRTSLFRVDFQAREIGRSFEDFLARF